MRPRAAQKKPFDQADQEEWSEAIPSGPLAFDQQSHPDATSASSHEQIENQTDASPHTSYYGPGVAPVNESMMRLMQHTDDHVSHLHNRPVGQPTYQHPHQTQDRFIAANVEPTQGFAGLRRQSFFTSSGLREEYTSATASASVYSPALIHPFIASPYAAAAQPNRLLSDLQQRVERTCGQHTAQYDRVSLRTAATSSSLTNSGRQFTSQPSVRDPDRQDRLSKRRRVDDSAAFRPAIGQLVVTQHGSESKAQAIDAQVYTFNDGIELTYDAQTPPWTEGLDRLAELMKDWPKNDVEAFVAASIAAFSENDQADEETIAEGQRLLEIIESVQEEFRLGSGSQPTSDYDRPVTQGSHLHETDASSTNPILPKIRNSLARESNAASTKQMKKRGTAPLNSTGDHFLSPKDPSRYKDDGKRRSFIVSTLPAGVTLPKDTPITSKEICIFFSECLSIAEVTYRMMRNKVKPDVLATWQLEAVGIADDDVKLKMRLDVIKQQKSTSGNIIHDRPRKTGWKTKEAEEQGLQHDLTANEWGQKEGIVFGHVYLNDIYGPVPAGSWPTGLDRGITTQCLEWAQQHQNQYPDLTTEDWDWVVEQLGAAARVPVLPAINQVNLDTDAVVRFRQTHYRDKPLPR